MNVNVEDKTNISLLNDKLSFYKNYINQLSGDMNKRSVQHIKPLASQVCIKRFIAITSTITVIAGAIIFQQPLLILGLSIPIYCTVTGLRQQRSIEAFSMCQSKQKVCQDLFKIGNAIYQNVAGAYESTFSEDSNLVHKAVNFLPQIIPDLKSSAERILTSINGLNNKFGLEDLQTSLKGFLITVAELEVADNTTIEGARENLEKLLTSTAELITANNQIAVQIEKIAALNWPLKAA